MVRLEQMMRVEERMSERDYELAGLRSARSYRTAVWGFRLALFAIALGLVVVGLSLAGVPSRVVTPIVLLVFLIGPLGLVVGWVSAILLAPRTTRYSRVTRRGPDVKRTVRLISALGSDVFQARPRPGLERNNHGAR
jgi:hypothetical protein